MTFNLFREIERVTATYRNVIPLPTKCKHCGHVYAGIRCPVCKRTQGQS